MGLFKVVVGGWGLGGCALTPVLLCLLKTVDAFVGNCFRSHSIFLLIALARGESLTFEGGFDFFLEKAKSNLKLCVVNKGDEQSEECGLSCCWDFFFFPLR